MRTQKGLLRWGLVGLVLTLATLPAARADFDQAMSLFKSSKYLEAASEFQGLVDESPDYADGHFMLGICFLKTSKYAEAEKAFVKAIELNPDKFEYHYNLANVYLKQKKWDKVVASLNSAEPLAANEQYKQAIYKTRGQAQVQRGKWEDAITDLDRVRPDAATLATLGKAYFKMGDNETAVAKLGQAAKLDPKNAEVQELRAEGLLNLAAKARSKTDKARRYDDALSVAKQFQQLKPGTFDGYYLVGRAALGAQAYDLAVRSFTDALKKKPDYCNAMVNQGKALMATKKWSDAYQSFDNATNCSPKMAQAWENKGYTLQKQDKLDEAKKVYERALQLAPGSSFVKDNLQIVESNIAVRDENQQIAEAERKHREDLRKAEEDYRTAKEKEETWKQKQEDD